MLPSDTVADPPPLTVRVAAKDWVKVIALKTTTANNNAMMALTIFFRAFSPRSYQVLLLQVRVALTDIPRAVTQTTDISSGSPLCPVKA